MQIYREDDEEVSSRHGEMSWVSRITHSLEEDRFVLHCHIFNHEDIGMMQVVEVYAGNQ